MISLSSIPFKAEAGYGDSSARLTELTAGRKLQTEIASLGGGRITAYERAVRPSKLGMKNWLFVGHPEAGQRAAIFYTIVQNCKNHGVDPQAYLTDVLERLPLMKNDLKVISELTPKNWSRMQKSASRG